jgi:hypothetical protein
MSLVLALFIPYAWLSSNSDQEVESVEQEDSFMDQLLLVLFLS